MKRFFIKNFIGATLLLLAMTLSQTLYASSFSDKEGDDKKNSDQSMVPYKADRALDKKETNQLSGLSININACIDENLSLKDLLNLRSVNKSLQYKVDAYLYNISKQTQLYLKSGDQELLKTTNCLRFQDNMIFLPKKNMNELTEFQRSLYQLLTLRIGKNDTDWLKRINDQSLFFSSLSFNYGTFNNEGFENFLQTLQNGFFPNLTRLSLSPYSMHGNEMEVLVNCIKKNIPNLTSLDLSDSIIEIDGFTILAKAIKENSIPNLTSLKVQDIGTKTDLNILETAIKETYPSNRVDFKSKHVNRNRHPDMRH